MLLRKLNLAPRSVLCFGFFCLLIIGMGLFALRQASALNDAEDFVETTVVPTIQVLGDLDKSFVLVRNDNANLRNPLETEEVNASGLAEITELRISAQEKMKRLSDLMLTPKDRALLDQLHTDIQAFNAIEDQYLDLIRANDLIGGNRYTVTDVRPGIDKVSSGIQALVELGQIKAGEAGKAADAVYLQTQVMVSVLIVTSLLATVLLAWLYTRSVTVPLGQSLAIARRIANNDFSQSIVLNGCDELARLLAALATMQTNLRETIAQIGGSSTQLATTAEQMYAVTENAARGMVRQNNEIEMAATAVTEMSAAVDGVASNAALASDAATQSSATAMSGRSRVDETLGALGLMVTSVRSTSSDVKRLSVMAVDISKVLDVIRAIAEQTNLLALNAAIEAARAGEAGRGFAVVADEVRALAHRTQVSTQEIEQMISDIQAGTGNAVASMDQTTVQAEKTLRLAEAAGQALAEITESITQINERNLLISTAAEEQAQVAREVDRSLISIRDLSTQTAAGSHQTSIVSAELSKLAVGLHGLVERFRL
ncbi:methyl-accepting chemotaxis protein [Pseudomonas sp. GM60]|nr:methyl-accepting chemotaxis protein [Pseudomonas sp. GM60]